MSFSVLNLVLHHRRPNVLESFSLTVHLGECPCDTVMYVLNFNMALYLCMPHAWWARVRLTRRGSRGRRG